MLGDAPGLDTAGRVHDGLAGSLPSPPFCSLHFFPFETLQFLLNGTAQHGSGGRGEYTRVVVAVLCVLYGIGIFRVGKLLDLFWIVFKTMI